MPTIVRGSLWNNPPRFIVIPTSTHITGRRGLEMTTRFAKQARRYSHLKLRQYAAEAVRKAPDPLRYGFLPLHGEASTFGIFQVKLKQTDPDDLGLLRNSTFQLRAFAKRHPELSIGMPFPTASNRPDIPPASVHETVAVLPENVTLFIDNPLLLPDGYTQ